MKRRELLAAAKPFLDKVHAAEDKKLAGALEKLGVDWSMAPAGTAVPQLELAMQTIDKASDAKDKGKERDRVDARVPAGANVKIRGVVKNVGAATAYRVRASLQSDSPMFDENEMVFGKIAPGESKTYDLVVKVPASSFTRTDAITGTLSTVRGVNAIPAELTLNIEGKARPRFAYTYQTIDDVKGNHDGQVQRGEQVRTLVTVKNIGLGRALHTEAVLRNGTGQEGILISAGRFDAKDMAPGESKTFSFVYEVGPAFHGDEYQLELAVGDTILGESVTDKIKIRVAPTGPSPEVATGSVTVARDDIPLREAAREGALVVGRAAKGTVFKVTGKVAGGAGAAAPAGGTAAGFTRVEIENGRTAFVATNDVKAGGTPHPLFRPEWQVTPPLLTVAAPSVVTGDTVHVDRTRERRSAGARRLHPGVEPRRQGADEEGLLPVEPRDGRSNQARLRGRRAAVAGQQHGPGVRAGIERGPVARHRGGAEAEGGPGRPARAVGRAARTRTLRWGR